AAAPVGGIAKTVEIAGIGAVGKTPGATDLIVKTGLAAIGRIASIVLRRQIVPSAPTVSNALTGLSGLNGPSARAADGTD
ncbi:MAG: hypothetical protein OEU87_07335, partial [Nitrospira sp.]|nr:hypothetical protein [Nitrospira sp.]